MNRAAGQLSMSSTTIERACNKQQEVDTWQATTVFEASHPGLLEQFYRVEAKVNSHGDSLVAIVDQVWQWLGVCRMGVAWRDTPLDDKTDPDGDPFALLPECVTTAQDRLNDHAGPGGAEIFHRRPAADFERLASCWCRWCRRSCWWAAAISGTGWASAAGIAVAVGVGSAAVALSTCPGSFHGICVTALRQSLADAERYQQRCRADAKAYYDSQRAKMAERHKREIREANERHFTQMTQIIADRDGRLTEADDTLSSRRKRIGRAPRSLARRGDTQNIRTSSHKSAAKFEQDQITFAGRARTANGGKPTSTKPIGTRWPRLGATAWRTFTARSTAMNDRCRELFPEWNDPAWKTWRPPTSPPPTIRFGQFAVRLDEVPGGVSADPRLNGLGPDVLRLPALLPFPHSASLLIQTTGEGRTLAACRCCNR